MGFENVYVVLEIYTVVESEYFFSGMVHSSVLLDICTMFL